MSDYYLIFLYEKKILVEGGLTALAIAFLYWLHGAINFGFQDFNKVTVEWSFIFLISATIIGMLIGWIYGKVKGKNKNQLM